MECFILLVFLVTKVKDNKGKDNKGKDHFSLLS